MSGGDAGDLAPKTLSTGLDGKKVTHEVTDDIPGLWGEKEEELFELRSQMLKKMYEVQWEHSYSQLLNQTEKALSDEHTLQNELRKSFFQLQEKELSDFLSDQKKRDLVGRFFE